MPTDNTIPASLGPLISEVVSQDPEASEIQRVARATALAVALDHTAAQLVEHFVENARREGRSWREIAAVLGVSRQAAHSRFAIRTTGSRPAGRTAHPGDTT
ncbi:AsnC family protein [Streptomyces paludis]|uniref:AsnC family protein n=1 Tax=Streptomyces paludis TaxID=2282738 RepID=A0A345HR22_9ACTN|nr:AsnC family protein [Streptomyces paludis]AXG79146.1 AsnC family protein [Streptomyces paludis]